MNKVRKFVRSAGLLLAVLSAIGLAALPSVRESYKGKAILTQRVQIDKAGASLFGDAPTAIGSPQLMIIDDPKAVVKAAEANSGVRQIDDGYLVAHQIYPLQLKTVDFTLGLVREALFALLIVGVSAFFLAGIAGKNQRRLENAAG